MTAVALGVWVATIAASVMYLRYAGLLADCLRQRQPEKNPFDRIVTPNASRLVWAILFQRGLFGGDAVRLVVPTRAWAAVSAVGIAASIIMFGELASH